jgi:26S proteasome regulatory subunit N2
MSSLALNPAEAASIADVPTASGWLALLQESDPALQGYALQQLLAIIDTQWHEVAQALPDLEALAEAGNKTAAAVASRVFFHLREPQQALRLALEAGEDYFDLGAYYGVTKKNPYVEQLVTAALDAYIEQQQKSDEGEHQDLQISPVALEALVLRLLNHAIQSGKAKDALGIALEAQNVDLVQKILQSSPELSPDALELCQSVVTHKSFRNQVLLQVAQGLGSGQEHLLVSVHHLLKQPEPVSEVLNKVFLSGKQDEALFGLQLCFDLVDTGDQAFCNKVASGLTDAQALRILTGGFSSELALSFLHRHSNADRLIMEQLKRSLEERGSGGRNSILHNASVITNAFLYAGTTNDSFLRDYLDWMKKASNW